MAFNISHLPAGKEVRSLEIGRLQRWAVCGSLNPRGKGGEAASVLLKKVTVHYFSFNVQSPSEIK